MPAKAARIAGAVWLAAVNGVLELWLSGRVPRGVVVEVFATMVAGSVAALAADARRSKRTRRASSA